MVLAVFYPGGFNPLLYSPSDVQKRSQSASVVVTCFLRSIFLLGNNVSYLGIFQWKREAVSDLR